MSGTMIVDNKQHDGRLNRLRDNESTTKREAGHMVDRPLEIRVEADSRFHVTAKHLCIELTWVMAGGDSSPEPDATDQIPTEALDDVWTFPLFEALFGRRARRFSLGAEIPDGPLQYTSEKDPLPLTEVEQSLLVASAVGVSGWHFGVPYTEAEPGLCTYSARFTGRPTPTAAGIGTVELFYTDDEGVYFVSTRDAEPASVGQGNTSNDPEELLGGARTHTTKLRDGRLSIPREDPHMSPHNRWNANVEGSTVFFPVADVAQQLLGFLCPWVQLGMALYDDREDRFAGDLEPYFESGLLDREKPIPLTYLEQYVFSTTATELGIMGHNMVLALQAMGLGGWLFTGMNPLTIMGASEGDDITGLEFQFQRRDDWTLPNPVGLDGYYEGFCPPYYPDMHAAVETFVEKKFGERGSYNSASSGPYSREVKATANEYSDELVEAIGEMAQYVYDEYGKFPATVPTIFMRPLVQAHHLDTDYYDAQFGPGSYLETHSTHMEQWHPTEGD